MTKSNKTLLCCLLTCVMVLACALTILPIATPTTANAETKTITLTFPDENNANNKVSSYDKSWTAKIGENEWTIFAFNNNSWNDSWNLIKCGSNKAESSPYIVATFSQKIDSIKVYYNITSANQACLTSKKLIVASDSEFNTIVEEVEIKDFPDSALNFKVSKQGENLYYKLAFECKKTSKNGIFEITQIEYTYEETSCSHANVEFVAAKPHTCTENGNIAYYKCNDCNLYFEDEACTKQIDDIVDKAAHTWGDVVATTPATCTADGVGTATCTVCGETKTETIPALGHNYSTDGKCTLCGAEKPAEKVYKLVKEVSELSEGDKIIFVAKKVNGETHYYAMGALGTNEYTAQEEVVVANEIVTLNAESKVVEVTLGKDSSGNWTFNTNEGQLFISGTSFSLEKGNNWYITINSKYEATIADYATIETASPVRILYNNSATRFKPYSSKTSASASMILPSIYKLEEPEAAKQFTVTETVTAVENGSILNNGTMYILPNGQIDVVYNVTANSGINALEGTIAWNAELFDFVSMTAGNIFGENNVTVSGESTTTKKIAVTIGASNNATGVLLTVRYQLKAGVTAEQLANAKFGFTADVLFGTDTTTKVANTATENTVPMAVRQDATLTVNGVDYTADDRTITLTYNGQDITAGTEEGSVLKIATNHTGYNADCLTWTVVKNAGNYVLKLAVAADGAYNAISEVTYTIVVKQVEIASTNIVITNNTASKDLLGGNAKWTEADFTITYNGETLPDEFSGLYQIAIVNGEVAQATAEHTLTVELTLTAQASVNYVLTGTDVAEGKLSKQFVVSVVNAAINIIGMPDNVERAYNAQAIELSGVSVEEGATLKIYVALNGGAEVEVTENLDTYVKNVGSYVVRFEAHKNANVYSQTRTYTITKCDLAKVELDYNGDTVTWTDTQTNGETVVVKYTIAATEITNHAYTATQKNTEEVKLVVSTDNANYNGYELTLANVYAVTFVDDKHETTTQYRFENQLATSITPAAVGGFAFDGWYVTDGETESKFDFTTAVTADVNLTAKWTALTFTVTLVNGTETQKFENVAYEALLSTLEITDASKADDEDNYYTFAGWTLTAEGETINLATTKVTDNMTLYAKFTSASNKFTLTWTLTYNGTAVENGTLTVKRNTALNEIVGLPTSKNANVLTIGTWKNGENDFTAMPTADIAITAAYGIALQAGDVNGDGAVNLDDVVLFRKYLVGGYAIDEIAYENIYTAITAADAASKTMFFKYSANMDNDANLDIRDVATIRMNVVVTTEGGEEQTQTTQSAARMEVVSEAVQYAVLPTNKFVA